MSGSNGRTRAGTFPRGGRGGWPTTNARSTASAKSAVVKIRMHGTDAVGRKQGRADRFSKAWYRQWTIDVPRGGHTNYVIIPPQRRLCPPATSSGGGMPKRHRRVLAAGPLRGRSTRIETKGGGLPPRRSTPLARRSDRSTGR